MIFHRPGRRESAVRQGKHKLFVKWTTKGEVETRELYSVDRIPTEEGNDIARKNSRKADELQSLLVNYLESVNAEKPKPRSKGKGKKRKKN